MEGQRGKLEKFHERAWVLDVYTELELGGRGVGLCILDEKGVGAMRSDDHDCAWNGGMGGLVSLSLFAPTYSLLASPNMAEPQGPAQLSIDDADGFDVSWSSHLARASIP